MFQQIDRMLNKQMNEKRHLKDRAIVIDERMMVSSLTSSTYTHLLPDHDLYYFSVNNDLTTEQMARKLSGRLFRLWQKGYEQIFFVGYKESCNIYYDLYNIKNFVFDSAVLIEARFDLDTIYSLSESDKNNNVLFLRKGRENTCNELLDGPKYMYQWIKTLLPVTYSPRVAKEIAGWFQYANVPPINHVPTCGSTFRLN